MALVAVVDDDESLQQALECLLQSQDYEVRLFSSASAMLDSDDLARVDCLISDVDMPGMDGFELLARVRGVRPSLPAILISGYPERLDGSPAFERTRRFSKPFRSEELLAALHDAVGDPRP